MLAWNAKITDTNGDPNVFSPTEPVVQNLNLQLYDSTTSFMGSLLDQSVSTVDNVEHIYLNSLGAGTYTLKVSGAANWDYGLAWRMTTAFDEPNADFDGDGVVSGSDFLVWQRNFGTLLGAANSDGDADGDGDVDDGRPDAVQGGRHFDSRSADGREPRGGRAGAVGVLAWRRWRPSSCGDRGDLFGKPPTMNDGLSHLSQLRRPSRLASR